MNVSFDGLRRNATNSFNSLTKYLNGLDSYDKEQIEKEMEDLRFALAVLNATSIEGEESFHDMSKELSFIDFNTKDNE